MTKTNTTESPATLVAILVAAHRVQDRELEREARQKLEERFGIKLTFKRQTDQGWADAR
jgi:hypothetical protein